MAVLPRVAVHRLSRAEARRIAVRAQLLGAARPANLIETVQGLGMLQLNPTAAVAPSADLVVWSRLGSSYVPDELEQALAHRVLIELNMLVRPAEDIALYRAEMADWPGTGQHTYRHELQRWVEANDGCRRDILARLAAEGPLTARVIPDTCARPWKSSGWTNDRNVLRLLDLMVLRGEVAVIGRRGKDRLWDLAERVYPDDPVVPLPEALRRRDELRLQALGIARSRAPAMPVEPAHVHEAGEPAEIDGVPGQWRVDPQQLDRPFSGRAALLSPLDRLVYDRKRTLEIFGFDFQLEQYKPAATRRWGYFALPILYGDRLIGKLDSAADRKAGVFRVHAIHQDVNFTRAMTEAVQVEIEDLARWLELRLELPE